MFVSPADEMKLRAEALAFQVVKTPNIEEAIGKNAEANAGVGEDQEFDSFHQLQNANRALRALIETRGYIACVENLAEMDRYIRSNFNNVVSAETVEQAFVDLAAAGQLLLDPNKIKSEDLDNLTTTELVNRQAQVEAQEAKNEQADRKLFAKPGAKAAIKFVQQHPDYVVCPENLSALNQWFVEHGVNPEGPTREQLNEAFADLKSQNALTLDKSKLQSGPSEQSLYDMDREELLKKAGGFDNGHGGVSSTDEYVPSGLYRGGPGVGFTFEPGSDR